MSWSRQSIEIVSCRECVHLANATSKGSVAYPGSQLLLLLFAEVIHLKPSVFRGLLFLPKVFAMNSQTTRPYRPEA
jgi:hypothetical protein